MLNYNNVPTPLCLKPSDAANLSLPPPLITPIPPVNPSTTAFLLSKMAA